MEGSWYYTGGEFAIVDSAQQLRAHDAHGETHCGLCIHAYVMEQTISDFAVQVGSSEITILRFYKKLGFSGLQSFKIALVAELYTQTETAYQDIAVADTSEMIVQKVFRNIADGLQDTLKLLDCGAVERAVDIIRGARRSAAYGFGNSATICCDIETRFVRFGMIVQAYSDAYQQAISASLLTERTPSSPSPTRAYCSNSSILWAWHRMRARVIVITSYACSLLAQIGDVVLHGIGREVHYGSFTWPSPPRSIRSSR